MQKTILAFGASSSKKSINQTLAVYAAGQVNNVTINPLDLNNFEMPIYSIDREQEQGIPSLAHQFKDHIKHSDGIVISFAEHNSTYTSAFKNIFDWVSRIDINVWENKPMFLLATSPGKRGAITVLELAVNSFQFINKNTMVHFSLPLYHQHFSEEQGILDAALKEQFEKQLHDFSNAVWQTT